RWSKERNHCVVGLVKIDAASAYRFTGAVCRLTHPAAVVLNDKTTKVIEAAFQNARYPSLKREKSLLFIGSLEIHNLSIGQSEFELHPGEGISMEIKNVSAVFRGTIQYGYGSWLVNVGHSVDFEIDSQLDLGINPKLYCGEGKVAADTSDCYLNFHKLLLHLQGDKEPNWLKKLFTDFITFTVKMVIKGQICIEINKVANILADFIQDTAGQFLSDGAISMDIGVTAAPVITANYIESYHKVNTTFINTVINDSLFHPNQLTENRMLYFWLSDQVCNPLLSAAHQDGRFTLNISGAELTVSTSPLKKSCSGSPELRVWSSSVPFLNTSTSGTTIWAEASGQLSCGMQGTPTLFFQTVLVSTKSWIYFKLMILAVDFKLNGDIYFQLFELYLFCKRDEAKSTCEVFSDTLCCVSVLEVELTRLLDKQGTNLFDIFNPEVLPRDGFVVIQTDFGFPHHLLVEFLKKTLQ
uniref:Cholesteryl ester transfer protein n=1 Tax=Labrus bergylta TaxID=56723 RepID=A0A3Q3FPS2_9LABR